MAVDYDSVPTETFTWDLNDSYGNQPCPRGGTVDGTTCTFPRMLCVTCKETDGQVRIRVQSNSLPNHGF